VVESAATELKGKITLHDLGKSLSDSNESLVKVVLPFRQFYAPEAQKAELDQSLFRKFQV